MRVNAGMITGLVCMLMYAAYATILWLERRRMRVAILREREAIEREREAIEREREICRAQRDHFASLSKIVRDGAPCGPTRSAWLFVADQLDSFMVSAVADVANVNARGGTS